MFTFAVLCVLALTLLLPTAARAFDNSPNPAAVAEVESGARTTANAAWWGFDEHDATDALQAAIHSGARRLVVPNMGADWVVRPIQLAGDQELILERGVTVAAMRGEYREGGDSLFTARDVENLTIRGYGATLRMWKRDYISGVTLENFGWNRWFGQYSRAEWRMTLAIRGCKNVDVSGLTLIDSGGDGVYVDGGNSRRFSENVRLRDLQCENHYRQGISVISVDGLTVESSRFCNTWGTVPSAGVDLEPDAPDQRIANVAFTNCQFIDNYGDGIEVNLDFTKGECEDVSMRFENCVVQTEYGAGIQVKKIRDTGPGGIIEFIGCVVDGSVGYGIKVQDISTDGAEVIFKNCETRNTAQNAQFDGEWTPIWLHLFRPEVTQRVGGVRFDDCVVEDRFDRPLIAYTQTDSAFPLFDVAGSIRASNPHGLRLSLGDKLENVALDLSAL